MKWPFQREQSFIYFRSWELNGLQIWFHVFFIYLLLITTKINNQVKISWVIFSYLCIYFYKFIYLVAKYFNNNQPRLFFYLPKTVFYSFKLMIFNCQWLFGGFIFMIITTSQQKSDLFSYLFIYLHLFIYLVAIF